MLVKQMQVSCLWNMCSNHMFSDSSCGGKKAVFACRAIRIAQVVVFRSLFVYLRHAPQLYTCLTDINGSVIIFLFILCHPVSRLECVCKQSHRHLSNTKLQPYNGKSRKQ